MTKAKSETPAICAKCCYHKATRLGFGEPVRHECHCPALQPPPAADFVRGGLVKRQPLDCEKLNADGACACFAPRLSDLEKERVLDLVLWQRRPRLRRWMEEAQEMESAQRDG